MNILIVDDSSEKIKSIVKEIASTKKVVNVDIREDIVSAIDALQKFQYHIAILDLQLPVRDGDDPQPTGGMNLVNEIYRKKKCYLPYLIFGLTQYEEIISKFPSLWKILLFDNGGAWKSVIHNAVNHVDRLLTQPTILKKNNVPTIYLEGETDFRIIDLCFRLFNPKVHEQINIEFQKSAGVNWVKNQIIAWAHLLNKYDDGNYIQSVGLFDGDQAGLDAISEVRRLIKSDSANSTTFSIIKLSPKYGEHLIGIYKKGVKLPVTLEELYCPEIWEYAKKNELLENRTSLEKFLSESKYWDRMNQSLSQYLGTCGLNDTEELYLQSFSKKGKIKVNNYIFSLSEKDQLRLLSNFKGLIGDLTSAMKI